jgi:O-methyltransferase involved in polyketide biosynthesis
MSEISKQNLNDVAETLLITLYIRAKESERPDAIIKDEKAVALIKEINYDFSQIKQIKIDETDQVTFVLRNREFDSYTQNFLVHYPESAIYPYRMRSRCALRARR